MKSIVSYKGNPGGYLLTNSAIKQAEIAPVLSKNENDQAQD